MGFSFEDSDAVYLAAERASIALRPVRDPAALALLDALDDCINLIRLTASPKGLAEDLRLWRAAVNRSVATLSELSGAQGARFQFTQANMVGLTQQLALVLGTQGADRGNALLKALNDFEALGETPLMSELRTAIAGASQLQGVSSNALVVFPGTWKAISDAARQSLRARRVHMGAQLEVVRDADLQFLKNPVSFSAAVYIGRPELFAPHVWTAPRVADASFIYYESLKGSSVQALPSPEVEQALIDGDMVWSVPLRAQVGTTGDLQPPAGSTPILSPVPAHELESDVVDDDDMDEEAWVARRHAILAEAARERARSELPPSDGETIEARVVALSGGCAGFVPANEDSRLHVLRFDSASGQLHVSEVTPNALEPGAYLIRRDGYSDAHLIREYADEDLGPRADQIRTFLGLYKRALMKAVARLGSVAAVERALQRKGMKTPNLQYKLSEDSIGGTRSLDDWRVLMEFLGLGVHGEADARWADLRELQDAHKRAGLRIREELETALAGQGRHAIDGSIDTAGVFALTSTGGQGPTFTLEVWRVEYYDPMSEPLAVSEASLARIFAADELKGLL